ncbi:hypothetical protein [Rhodococcus sp. As11]|uniref:hypothetical protein n=1 Tax=Rhodococcus sp. As11 TaxID=3029189 RepID=UPI003B812D6D
MVLAAYARSIPTRTGSRRMLGRESEPARSRPGDPYGAPHVDMHFSTTDADHGAGPAAKDFVERAARLPGPHSVPQGCIRPPGSPLENTVPVMRMH